MKFYSEIQHFHSRKCVWICRLRNGGHFVQGKMNQMNSGSLANTFCIIMMMVSKTRMATHYGDVIMGVITSQITSLTIVYSSVYSDRRRSKKTSELRVTGLGAGNSPGTGEFPAQMASNAENISIWWRHHVLYFSNTYGTVSSAASQLKTSTLYWCMV